MAFIKYNQKGYIGRSMSVRAADAYENNEKPKSKWTKQMMIDEINDFLAQNQLDFNESVCFQRLNRRQIFDRFFTFSSWHHTSKFAHDTDFFRLDENRVLECTHPLKFGEIPVTQRMIDNKIQREEFLQEQEFNKFLEQEEIFKNEHRGLSKYDFRNIEKVYDMYPEISFEKLGLSKSKKSTNYTVKQIPGLVISFNNTTGAYTLYPPKELPYDYSKYILECIDDEFNTKTLAIKDFKSRIKESIKPDIPNSIKDMSLDLEK